LPASLTFLGDSATVFGGGAGNAFLFLRETPAFQLATHLG
jgi:hypothetical protein